MTPFAYDAGRYQQFLLTRPLRDVTGLSRWQVAPRVVSTHTPLAGRDDFLAARNLYGTDVSTHTPLAGRDQVRSCSALMDAFLLTRPLRDVTSRNNRAVETHGFLLTRPLRDVTSQWVFLHIPFLFLLTRPLRDVT